MYAFLAPWIYEMDSSMLMSRVKNTCLTSLIMVNFNIRYHLTFVDVVDYKNLPTIMSSIQAVTLVKSSYTNKKTLLQEKKCNCYKLEVTAITSALKKFKAYLLGIEFKIVTDCQDFQKTTEMKDISPKITT